MADAQSTKTCPRCKQQKSLTEFWKNPRTKDGLQCYCKPCSNAMTASGRKKQPHCRRCKQPRPFKTGQHGICQSCLNFELQGLFVCTKCNQPKSKTDFTASKYEKRGFLTECNVCRNDRLIRGYYTDSGNANQKQRQKKYNSKESSKKKARERSKRRRQRHPLKYQCGQAVNRAVLHGKIPRVSSLKCDKCGNSAQHYHHYNGYEKEHWFDIIPLCTICHGKEHAKSPYAFGQGRLPVSTSSHPDRRDSPRSQSATS